MPQEPSHLDQSWKVIGKTFSEGLLEIGRDDFIVTPHANSSESIVWAIGRCFWNPSKSKPKSSAY